MYTMYTMYAMYAMYIMQCIRNATIAEYLLTRSLHYTNEKNEKKNILKVKSKGKIIDCKL